MEDAALGERVKAVVARRPGSSLTAGAARRHAAAWLADFKVPTTVEFLGLDELPMTGSGKVAKARLKAEDGRRALVAKDASDLGALAADHVYGVDLEAWPIQGSSKIDDDGFHITVNGEDRLLDVTDVVLCAGQVSQNDLYRALETKVAPKPFVIGGAQKAGELDAKRAIDQGYRLAAKIENADLGDVFEMPVGWKASALKSLRDVMGRTSA